MRSNNAQETYSRTPVSKPERKERAQRGNTYIWIERQDNAGAQSAQV